MKRRLQFQNANIERLLIIVYVLVNKVVYYI